MQRIESEIIPLPRANIDTDMIIPAEFLTVTVKTGLGEHLFKRVRSAEKDFPLNQARYQRRQILVTRQGFGGGSSREHAAWAIKDWGIRVIIAPSFADIFFSNSLKNGLLPLVLDEEIVEFLFRAELSHDQYRVTVDLEAQVVYLACGKEIPFSIDPYHKESLLHGYDDLDLLLQQREAMREFDTVRCEELFLHIPSESGEER